MNANSSVGRAVGTGESLGFTAQMAGYRAHHTLRCAPSPEENAMRRSALGFVAVVLTATFALVTPGPADSQVAFPQKMVAVGDSITAATDVAWCCVDPSGRNPQYSWSTGTEPAVDSQAQRLVAASGGAPLATWNAAVPGADSSDLRSQFGQALAFGADYVTVLIGGNDLCWNPTPLGVFRQRVRSAFADYFAAAPNSRVFVSSIPNIYRLWSTLHTNLWAQLTWNVFDICPEMLSASTTEAQRQKLLQLETSFNDVLASTCAQYAGCRWDGYATFNYNFTASDISTVDYFHPSIQGQNTLATITWNASYWG
jgi:lysophospholipase L1-like esterase